MATMVFPEESGIDPSIVLQIQPGAEHSPLGPSASERWLECPGSVLRTVGRPDESSDYAAEGTAAHLLSEWVREQNRPASYFQNQTIEVEGKEFRVDAEMVDAVQAFVDFVEELAPEADVKMYEARVTYTPWVPGGFGTSDDIRILQVEKTCYITDLKYGKGIKVLAENNPQGMLYAAGVFHHFSHLYDIERFVISIAQPRLNHYDTWELSVVDLLQWLEEEAKPIAHSALRAGAPVKAGEWCRFCPVKRDCPERVASVQEGLADEFARVDAEPKNLSNKDLGAILDKAAEYAAFIKDIQDEGLRRLQSGDPPIGKEGPYKLVEGRGSRGWTDEEEAEKALRKKLKVSQVFEKKLITVAKAEKLVGKTHPAIRDHAVRTRGKPTMVPASDPRPNYQATADEFEDVSGDAAEK